MCSVSRSHSHLHCRTHVPLLDVWWENKWPTDVADRVDASMPTFLNEAVAKRTTQEIADADRYVV